MFVTVPASSSTAPQTPFLPTMAKRTASEASEPVVQEVPVISVEDFDISLFAAKARGLKKDGQRVYTTSYNHKRLKLNLTPGKKWLEIKYRIQPSDLSQNDNRMKVKFVVSEKMASIIGSIEDEVKKVVMPGHEATEFYSALKDDTFGASLVLESKSDGYLRQCKVRPRQSESHGLAGSRLAHERQRRRAKSGSRLEDRQLHRRPSRTGALRRA